MLSQGFLNSLRHVLPSAWDQETYCSSCNFQFKEKR